MNTPDRRILAVSLLLSLRLLAQPQERTARLVGLWGGEQNFGPQIRGELTILRSGKEWTATIGGIRAPVHMERGAVTFTLAGGQGRFRGRVIGNSTRIAGHWVQPLGTATAASWATPVDLEAMNANAWRGTVTPLSETVSLYLDVRRETDGSFNAALRNPDGYFQNGRARPVLEGAHLRLLSIDNGATLLEGTYTDAGGSDDKSDRLALFLPDLKTTFGLVRRARDEAVGYYPRTPPEPRYSYHPPLAEPEGWRTASLAEVGLDEVKVSALVQKIIDVDPAKQTSPLVQGLLIARHRRLVLEEYFYGFDKERPHDLRSAGKTFASVLFGIALEKGAKLDVREKVYSLFPEYSTFANPDPRKQDMTVEHLMTMTSGFDCDENGNENAPGNEEKMQSQTAQPDWYKFMLDIPLAHAAGQTFAYCSGGVNLIGGIVRNRTGRWLPDLFREGLAQPLQMHAYHFNLTPSGEGYLGGGLHLRPRDELKLGQAYLDGGTWNGRRLVGKAWIAKSIAHPASLAGTDGYDWHLHEIKVGDHVVREYEASGNGGQFLIVLPELDLAVVFTAGNYQNYGVWRRFRDEFLPQYIIPAVKGGQGN